MKKATLFLLSLLCFTVYSFKTGDQTGYKPGDIARDFSLLNVDGRKVALSDYKKAKGFIVVFTCNHCPFSQAYEQRIIELHQKYAPLGFSVVAINSNDPDVAPADSYDKMKERAKSKIETLSGCLSRITSEEAMEQLDLS